MQTHRAGIAVTLFLMLVVTLATSAGAAGVRSWRVAGRVTKVVGTTVQLDVGTGLVSVGRAFTVYRLSRNWSVAPKGGVSFKHAIVGRVRIDKIVDEHTATATLLGGKVRAGDVVRLEHSH